MIYLITAPPGSGKTLYAVYQIHKMLERFKSGETPRPIYANINGLQLEHEPAPHDWRDTPEGSVIFYDEAQKIFPSDGRTGVAQDDRIRSLEEHRHTGHDIWLITQHPTLIHQHIRKLVGKHYHIHRSSGFARVTVWQWDEAVSNPRGGAEKKRAVSSDTFKYPKQMFELYQSTTLDTHKPTIPGKLKVLIASFLAIASFTGYNMYRSYQAFVPEATEIDTSPLKTAAQSMPLPQLDRAKSSSDKPEQQPFVEPLEIGRTFVVTGGCIRSDDDCECWDAQGSIINVNAMQCEMITSQRLRRPLTLEFRQSVPVDYSPVDYVRYVADDAGTPGNGPR